MAEKIGKKEENIQNPGTRVLRFKNPNPFFMKNPGTQPGLGTRVKTLGRMMIWFNIQNKKFTDLSDINLNRRTNTFPNFHLFFVYILANK